MLAIIAVALSSWVIFYIVLSYFGGRRQKTKLRLEKFVEGASEATPSDVEEGSFFERVLLPILRIVYNTVELISPKGLLERTELKLKQIGYSGPHVVQQWIALRVTLGMILPLMVGILAIRMGMEPWRSLLAGLLPMLMVQVFMTMYLLRGVQRKKVAIEKQLPDVLDIITVSVEAGLSFDGALERVVQKMNSHLAVELGTTLKEMRMGKLRRQALKDLSDRCQVPDITTWVGAMIQADELGVGIGNVLRVQSAQMREKRRQRAREKSMKAPIKMMFPLVFFIFPTIFVVLMGPAVIKVIDTLFK